MRADRSFRRALAALPLLLGLVGSATACSVFTLDCKKLDGGVVSARTMDFMRHAEVGWRIDVMPPGVQYPTREPCPGCAAPSFTTRLPFAGLTGIGGDIWVDGLNSQGLTAAYLWLETHPFELNYSSSAPGAPMAWLDVMPYMLGHFSTVKEAVAWATSDEVQITTDLAPGQAYMERVLRPLGFRTSQIPLHMALSDATGASVLLEFTGSRKAEVHWGAAVVTNDPPYPEHQRWMGVWTDAIERAKAQGGSVDPLPPPPDTYARVPGNWDSLPRDIRTRMLLEVACDEYPDREWSPKPGGILPSTAAAMSILRSVEVPWGANGDPPPGSFSAGDTMISMLREHATGLYLWRSPGSPRWQGVRLRDADWSAYGGARRAIELSVGAEAWFADLTSPSGGGEQALSGGLKLGQSDAAAAA